MKARIIVLAVVLLAVGLAVFAPRLRPQISGEGGEPGSKCHVLWAGVERVDNREWSHMPVLPEGNGPVTLRDVWLFAATSVAFIFIMMITAGLIGQLFF